MSKVGFITLGCKVNIYESNALKNELEANGITVCEAEPGLDAYVINTCSVTNQADAKSRKMIHKAQKLNPEAIICVMGCYPQTNKEALSLEGIDIMVGNGNKKEIATELIKRLENKTEETYRNILDLNKVKEYEPLGVTTFDHTRAFVKIEDGCDNYCAYCIIPYARGHVRCKPSCEVIKELQRIADMGYLEVVLSGIHTGRYDDGKVKFSGLVEMILKEVPKLKKIRVSSIEINEVDDHFIELMKTNKVIADHIHLPLQSGSDEILKRMGRRYDKAYFKQRVDKIRSARPDISLTTDVIVGFPYETDELYQESKDFIKEINFSKIHVFPFSKRSGTKAELMPQVKDSVKKERALDLIALSDELEKSYLNKYIGKEIEMIVEMKLNDKQMIGHTSNFLSVIVPYKEELIAKSIIVKIEKTDDEYAYGVVIQE